MRKLLARIDALVNRLVKNYTLLVFIGLLLLGVIAVQAWHTVFPVPPQPAVYSSLVYLPQGWGEQDTPISRRERYYQTAQGNLVAPFSWYMALERDRKSVV